MKVLIVDDNFNHASKIVTHLITHTRIARSDIETVHTAQDARRLLSSKNYDLLILDILLPNRVETEPSVETSLTLLTEVAETATLLKPRKIVGVTAYSDAEQKASKAFIDQCWTIVSVDDTKDDWLVRLQRCTEYLMTEGSQSRNETYDYDVLLLTALRTPEMEAVKNIPWCWTPERPLDDQVFYSTGELDCGQKKLRIVAATPDRMGMVPTATLAGKLIARFRPRLCVMSGICAGIPKASGIGDAIFAESTWDYQSGKYISDEDRVSGFEMDPHFIQTDPKVAARIDQLANDSNLLNQIWMGWPNRPPTPPKLLRGPVACGSAVLADDAATRKVLMQQRKTKAIEMEMYGLYFAGQFSSDPRPMTFGIKSVCDFANSEKNDKYQHYAAYTSAQILRHFLERFGADFL